MKEIRCPHCEGYSVCNIVKRYFERYNRGRLDSELNLSLRSSRFTSDTNCTNNLLSTSGTKTMKNKSRNEHGHLLNRKRECVKRKNVQPVIVLNNPFELLNDDSAKTVNIAFTERKHNKKQYISLKTDCVDVYKPKSEALWADMLEQEFDDNVW